MKIFKKNILIGVIALVYSILFSFTCFAAVNGDIVNITSKTNVSVSNTFKINFNQMLDRKISPNQYVFVFDDKGQAVNINAVYGIDGKSIMVSPSTNYAYGKNYYISVQNARSEKGNVLAKNVRMSFSTVNFNSKTFKVCIDPGHGGNDTSDIIGASGTKESAVDLNVALKLGQLLSSRGVQVVYTRNTDKFVDLDTRFNISDENNSDFFISLHCNSFQNKPTATGIETYYKDGNSFGEKMASFVQEEITKDTSMIDRGPKPSTSYKELNNIDAPGIKIYLGFLSSPSDEKVLSSKEFQDNSATAIADSVIKYINYYGSINGGNQQIKSVNDIVLNLKKGQKFSLPTKVSAILSDGTIKQIDVKWTGTAVNTNTPGKYSFEGTVIGYSKKVMLAVNVSSSPITICIDAGHGGYDSGAVGPTKVFEKNITLPIALKVGDILSNKGLNIVYTRNSDSVSWPSVVIDDLQARCDISDKAESDYFICIHANSCGTPSVDGIETYYFDGNEKGKALASCIQKALVDVSGLNDRGIKTEDYYVLKHTADETTAILTEIGFISNAQEEKRLNSDEWQNKYAQAVAQGILDYLNQ